MINKDSKTFCIFPWIHQHITTSGDVLPCCTANYKTPLGNIKNNSIEEIWNNENFKKLRLNMLNGIKSEHCNLCYKNEELAPNQSNNSYRKGALEEFKEFLPLVDRTANDGSLPELSLRYFDVRWSNICNFKCRTCNDGFSSSIAQENSNSIYKDNKNYQIFIKASNNNQDLLNQFKPHLKDMKVIYFAGGEPLITEEHYNILDYLIENQHTDIILRYNSNISNLYYKKKSIIEYWKNFKSIEVMASIDSWGERAQYIRHGTKWSEVLDNLRTIKKHSHNIRLTINSVIGIFNCLTLIDFLEELEKNNIVGPGENLVFLHNQMYPEWQNCRNIPLELRLEQVKKIDAYIDRNDKWGQIYRSLELVKQNLKEPYNSLNKDIIKREISRLDTLRNESFKDTFPELSFLFE